MGEIPRRLTRKVLIHRVTTATLKTKATTLTLTLQKSALHIRCATYLQPSQLTAVISLHSINLSLFVTHKLRYFSSCTVQLSLFFITTNTSTINIIKVYITAMFNLYFYMFRHFYVIITEFTSASR